MSIDLEGSICDAEAARLLPWFVNGRLSAADADRVTQHLEHCGICRADVAEQRALRVALKSGGSVEYAPQAGLAKTLARIDELTRDTGAGFDAEPVPVAAGRSVRRFGVTQWLTAAVIVQAIGLGVVGSAYLARPGTERSAPRYATLSAPALAPAASGPHIRAVFAESMTVAELKSLLANQNLLIVAGPSEAGVFTLGLSAAGEPRLEVPLAGLRASRQVLFAEPASGDGPATR